MIPRKLAPLLFGFILSGLMSLIVSAVTILRVSGFDAQSGTALLASWITAWAIAFPTVSVVAPLAHRMVDRLVSKD
jgi:hypothetical protein